MAKIIPFKGLRYHLPAADLEKVVAPPYDVIGDEQRDFLYDRHPNNIVRLIKGKELPGDGPTENKYSRARQYLEQWVESRILRQDERPCIYIYEQQYQYGRDRPRTRRGFIALARLEDQESGVILGHEQTLLSPKFDRLSLIKECRANLSPIFSLFSQPDDSIDSILIEAAFTPPADDFLDDGGIRNRFWVVTDPEIIEALTTQMEDMAVIIADGHHRYETALIYRHIRRSEKKADSEDAPYNYIMMMFVNLDGEGVTIYPIHRIVHGIPDFDPSAFRSKIEKYFDSTAYSFTCSDCEEVAQELLGAMARVGEATNAFGLYLGGRTFDLLKLRDDARIRPLLADCKSESRRALDVSVAQAVILQDILGINTENISKEEHVRYTPSGENAIEAVRRGEAQVALLLNPTRPDQVRAVTHEGERMPQKSTFFYPKLLSGLVINRLDA